MVRRWRARCWRAHGRPSSCTSSLAPSGCVSGRAARNALIHSLTFDAFNKQFRPVRTEADWPSRDTAEVDKYLADPLCRFQPALQLWIDLLDSLAEIARPERQARIPKELPIYVIFR